MRWELLEVDNIVLHRNLVDRLPRRALRIAE